MRAFAGDQARGRAGGVTTTLAMLPLFLLLVAVVPGTRAPAVVHAQGFPSYFSSDPIRSNTDTTLGGTSDTGNEPTIAVDPTNPMRVVMIGQCCGFGSGSSNAKIFVSNDGGQSWTYNATMPPPPMLTTGFAPCDQVADYGRDGVLHVTMLTCDNLEDTETTEEVGVDLDQDGSPTSLRVFTGSTTDPTDPTKWTWSEVDDGNAALDQPFVTSAADPAKAGAEKVYTSYVDRNTNTVHVSVLNQASPPVKTNDLAVGATGARDTTVVNAGCVLPQPRLASAGKAVYLLYQRGLASNVVNNQCIAPPETVTYQLTESVDGGKTWGVANNSNGIDIATVPVDIWPGPAPELGGVNMVAGVDALGADQKTGTVYVAYGADTNQGGGGNQLYMSAERLAPSGGAGISTEVAFDVPISARSLVGLPSVAVQDDGRVGVLYDTDAGTTGPNGLANIEVHVALSNTSDITQGFQDQLVSIFEATQVHDPAYVANRQRNLGDYQKMVAVGNQLFAVFAGNRANYGGNNQIDPIFFKTDAPASTRFPPNLGSVIGVISSSSPGLAAAAFGAYVTLCNQDRSTCFHTLTDNEGVYRMSGVMPGRYGIDVVSGSGDEAIARCADPCVDLVTPGRPTVIRAMLSPPTPPPAGTSFGDTPQTTAGNPILDAQDASTLSTDKGCAGGAATYTIRGTQYGASRGPAPDGEVDFHEPGGRPVTVSGAMTAADPTQTFYQATIPPLAPISGRATVSISFSCPSGSSAPSQLFDIYIDPSGTVVDQNGRPIDGATVTLLAASTASGPFHAVPAGSSVLSPTTRTNPETTGSDGRFRWDVGGNGFYKVRASAPGCLSPSGDPAAATVPLQIPPAITGLVLRLQCGGTDAALDVLPRQVTLVAGQASSPMVATFTDIDHRVTASEYSASVDWGDGSGTQPATVTKRAIGDLAVGGGHAYASAGTYPVVIVVHDVDGGQPDVRVAARAIVLTAPAPPATPTPTPSPTPAATAPPTVNLPNTGGRDAGSAVAALLIAVPMLVVPAARLRRRRR